MWRSNPPAATVGAQEGPAATTGPAGRFIERESGHYRITETRLSLISILNDLHKGRDTGTVWPWVIDASAGMLSFASLTGLILLLRIKRRRRLGLLTGIPGTLSLTAIAHYLVP